MEDPVYKSTLELRDALTSLKSEIDSLKDDATRNGCLDKDQTQLKFRNNVLPHLLRLRALNRKSKNSLEDKYDGIKDLNRTLTDLTESCENIIYEASTMNHDIILAKKRLSPTKSNVTDNQGDIKMGLATNGHDDYFDLERVADLDHATRLQKMDEEELRRRKLQSSLNELTEEVVRMREIPKMAEVRLNKVKPYIKELVERVDDLLNDN